MSSSPLPHHSENQTANPIRVAIDAGNVPRGDDVGDEMRGMRFRWRWRGEGLDPTAAGDSAGRSGQSRSGQLPALVQRVLAARGLTDPDELAQFVSASLRDMHDVSLMPGIEDAAERILASLRSGRPLFIYGDYDVDGITATAVLFHTLKTIAPEANVRSYVPHRVSEGYGLNVEAIEQLAADGADLIISVDCGITGVESAARAQELGVDLIITDHHNPPGEDDELPPALALVHPRLPGSAYPYGELCGAGVAFKLAWRVATMWCGSERVTDRLRAMLMNCLAFVALGTIADVVPLTGENRILAKFGMKMMRQTGFVGLNALIDVAGLADEGIDTEAVGFRLAPRLNACGRMGHAQEAVELFTTATPEEAMKIARQLNEQNQQRRATERSIFEQACAMAEAAGMTGDDRRIIVLADESWHPGVVGIVCSRLVERYGRPAVLLQRGDDVLKGSARSIDGYSIHAGLEAVSDHLRTFGGHDMAAGLTVAPESFESMVSALTDHANEAIAPEDLVPSLHVDCAAEIGELDMAAVRTLLDLGPFGRGNPTPTLLLRGLRLVEDPRPMGSGGRHLSLRVDQSPDADGRPNVGRGSPPLRLVAWGMGELADELTRGMTIDVVIRAKLNTWRGRTSVEGELRDLRIAGRADRV